MDWQQIDDPVHGRLTFGYRRARDYSIDPLTSDDEQFFMLTTQEQWL
jgi:hypothetical protein